MSQTKISSPNYGERNMKSIAIFNPRGGSGRTSVSIHLCEGLARLGKKTLLIDFDPQSHITCAMWEYLPENYMSLSQFIKGEVSLNKIIYQHKYFDFIPSGSGLYSYNCFENYKYTRKSMKEMLSKLESYDFVLIDCPSSLGIINLCIISTARYIISPITYDIYIEKSLDNLFGIINGIKSRKINYHRIIFNKYDTENKIFIKYVEDLRKRYGDIMFKTVIRDSKDICDSIATYESIFDYDRSSIAAHDCLEFSLEVINSFT